MVFKISEAVSDVYQGIFQRANRMDYIGKAYILKSLVDLALYCGILLVTNDLLFAICGLSIGSTAIVCIYERATARPFSNQKKTSSDVKRIWEGC